jgi:L-lactate dehydrogenase complex protein LldG
MATNSKEEILGLLRDTPMDEVALPEFGDDWIRYEDRIKQFSETLSAVGGSVVRLRDEGELDSQLAQLPAYTEANRICSLVDGVDRANVDLSQVDDPHQLEDVDFFVARGEFAVAENAAIWATDVLLKHRVLFFLTQHLAMVVPADQIVDNMHQAYERLQFTEPGFGLFVSGPSKTADIEQSLVIGAHGARSMTVFLVGESSV